MIYIVVLHSTDHRRRRRAPGGRENKIYKYRESSCPARPGGDRGAGWLRRCRPASGRRRCWRQQKGPECEILIKKPPVQSRTAQKPSNISPFMVAASRLELPGTFRVLFAILSEEFQFVCEEKYFTSEMSVGSHVSHCSLGRLEVLRSRDSSYRTCHTADWSSHNWICNNIILPLHHTPPHLTSL